MILVEHPRFTQHFTAMNRLVLICACYIELATAAPAQNGPAILPAPPQLNIPTPPAFWENRFGKQITETFIEFRGPSFGVSSTELLQRVKSLAPAALSEEQINADIKALLSSGLVTDVQYETDMRDGKLQVCFVVSSLAKVAGVEFRGNTVFDAGLLKEELPMEAGGTTNGQKVMEGAAALRTFHSNDYYTEAEVTVKAAPSAKPGFHTIIYTIVEGGRNLIKEVRFEGNQHLSREELMAIISTPDADFSDDSQLQRRLSLIEKKYQEKGYVYAKVTEVQRQRLSDQEAVMIYVIAEGDRYIISDIKIKGNTVFKTEILMSGLKLDTGLPYNGTELALDQKLLSDYYHSKGYVDANIEASLLETGQSAISLSYLITEGTKSHVGKINVAGNAVTKSAVILRGLDLSDGDVLNGVQLDDHKTRLERSGMFGAVDVRSIPTSTPGIKDIDIHVVEGPYLLNFGFGYSSIDGPNLFIKATDTNFSPDRLREFRGDGINASLDLQMKNLSSTMNLKVASDDFFGRTLILKLPELKEEDQQPASAKTPGQP
jgi:outer membrane protein insertion porin family